MCKKICQIGEDVLHRVMGLPQNHDLPILVQAAIVKKAPPHILESLIENYNCISTRDIAQGPVSH